MFSLTGVRINDFDSYESSLCYTPHLERISENHILQSQVINIHFLKLPSHPDWAGLAWHVYRTLSFISKDVVIIIVILLDCACWAINKDVMKTGWVDLVN